MPKEQKSDLRDRILNALREAEPALGLHGGGVELVDVTDDNVAILRFTGACVGCIAADMTLEYGLRELLLLRIEELSDVIAVDES